MGTHPRRRVHSGLIAADPAGAIVGFVTTGDCRDDDAAQGVAQVAIDALGRDGPAGIRLGGQPHQCT